MKSPKFSRTKFPKNTKNKSVIKKLIEKTNTMLKSNFPVKTVPGEAINWRVIEVPLSSSETNTLDSPDMEAKKIVTQYNPDVNPALIFWLPIENNITLTATIMNIRRELTAYLVLNSD